MKLLIILLIIIIFIICIFWIFNKPRSLNGFSLLQLDSKTQNPSQFVLFGENGICSILIKKKWKLGNYNWSFISQKLEYWVFKSKSLSKTLFLQSNEKNSSWVATPPTNKSSELPIVVWKMNKKQNKKPVLINKIVHMNQFKSFRNILLPFFQFQILSMNQIQLWQYNTILPVTYKANIKKIHPFYWKINIPSKNISVRLFFNKLNSGNVLIKWIHLEKNMNIFLPFDIQT